MKQHHETLTVSTQGQGLQEITGSLRGILKGTGVTTGSLTAFILHTSASLLIQENADDSARRDLEAFLARLAPEDEVLYQHSAEGPDDMPSHLRAALTPTSLSIPVLDGKLRLGPWQGVFVWEHRQRGHRRLVAVHVIGE